jgi:hypothetical protein
MKGALKLFLLSIGVWAASYALDRLVVPDLIVPLDWANEPQPVWQMEVGFMLRSTQAIVGMVACLALWIGLALWIESRRPLHDCGGR